MQCEFNINGGCQACQDCKAEPHMINTTCARCLSCENIPNNLRWDDKEKKLAEDVSLSEMIGLTAEEAAQIQVEKEKERENEPIKVQR